jgi:hypothetical protein
VNIKILKAVAVEPGKVLHKGEVCEVPKIVAQRWVAAGYAVEENKPSKAVK